MNNPADITLTLLMDSYDTYRVTAHTTMGANFVTDHIPGDTEPRTLPVKDARPVTDKAERCGLAVRIE